MWLGLACSDEANAKTDAKVDIEASSQPPENLIDAFKYMNCSFISTKQVPNIEVYYYCFECPDKNVMGVQTIYKDACSFMDDDSLNVSLGLNAGDCTNSCNSGNCQSRAKSYDTKEC